MNNDFILATTALFLIFLSSSIALNIIILRKIKKINFQPNSSSKNSTTDIEAATSTNLQITLKEYLLNAQHLLSEQKEFGVQVTETIDAAYRDIAKTNAKLEQMLSNVPHESQLNAPNTSKAMPPTENIETKNALIPAVFSDIQLLVVDDNIANVKLITELCKNLNIQVISAESGYAALQICEKQHFHLIFMDIQMPGMDGFETTRQLRNQEVVSRTPIIALTANKVTDIRKELLLSGMDDCISKPINEHDLRHIIERWIKTLDVHNKSIFQFKFNEIYSKKISPSNEQMPHSPLVDISESLRLANHKPDLAADMLSMLIESLADTEEKIITYRDSNRMDELLEIVHKFHGGCCYCGTPTLRTASQILEEALHTKQFDKIAPLTDNLLQKIQEFRAWSEEHDIEYLFSETC